MAIKKLKTDSREEWLQLRQGYIGGSDAGAIAGLNPYSSPYKVWAEKTGKAAGFEGNIITKVGSYLEELVAQMFEEETGKKVKKCNFTLVNDLYPWACADVDRLIVGEDALLECKTTNSYVNVRKFKNEEFPEQWLAQCIHYLAVTGKKKAYLAVLSECREFRIFEIERDQEEINALMRLEEEFWQHVTDDTPPPADGSESTAETLTAVYPNSNDEQIELFGFEYKLQARQALKERIKEMQTEIDNIENAIKAEMADAGKAKCGDYFVTWQTQTRNSFDFKAFKKDHPEFDFSAYEKQTNSRVFKIKN